MKNCNKKELIEIIRSQEKELFFLNRIYQKSIRYSASLRYVLYTEFTTNKRNWQNIVDDLEVEEEETPPPPPKKEQLKGYQ